MVVVPWSIDPTKISECCMVEVRGGGITIFTIYGGNRTSCENTNKKEWRGHRMMCEIQIREKRENETKQQVKYVSIIVNNLTCCDTIHNNLSAGFDSSWGDCGGKYQLIGGFNYSTIVKKRIP